jgi:hypothetical protein
MTALAEYSAMSIVSFKKKKILFSKTVKDSLDPTIKGKILEKILGTFTYFPSSFFSIVHFLTAKMYSAPTELTRNDKKCYLPISSCAEP